MPTSTMHTSPAAGVEDTNTMRSRAAMDVRYAWESQHAAGSAPFGRGDEDLVEGEEEVDDGGNLGMVGGVI